MTVNGASPLVLSSGEVEYFSAAFFLRNPLAGGLPQDALSIIRHRFVGDGMQDHVIVENNSIEPVAFELALELEADFADILSVKEHDFALGDPARAEPLPEPVVPRYEEEHSQFVLEEANGEGGANAGDPLQRGDRGRRVVYRLELAPRESWELRLDILASIDGDTVTPRTAERRFGEADAGARVARCLAAARAAGARGLGPSSTARSSSPSPTSPRCACRRGTHRPDARGRDAVVHDRLRARHADHVPADAALRSRAGAHGARGAGRAAGARRQPDVDAEPGKIVHELRSGKAPRSGSGPATARSMRRRSASCCCRRSGAGPTMRPSCAS